MPAAPRMYLIAVARRFPAAFVCHRYLIVMPNPVPAALFLERRTYVIEVPMPVPKPLLDREYLIAVPRPFAHGAVLCASQVLFVMSRPWPAAPFAVRRTYLAVVLRTVPRPLPAATRRCRIRTRRLSR
jgi:hypothetical protein